MAQKTRAYRAFLSPMGIASVIGLSVLILLTVIAPIIWGTQASNGDPFALSQTPTAAHPLGTDAGGRDILLRILVATRLSIGMAIGATIIGVSLGVLLGCLPSVLPPRLGKIVYAGVNLAVAFPALLLTIFLSVILGQGVLGALLSVGLATAPAYARLATTLSSSVAGRDFISAARILGASKFSILLRHIIPNIREPLIVLASISAGTSILTFAGLSFLGLGVQAPDYDWGRMLADGISFIYVNPAIALAPGVAVVITGLLFTLFGETLAKALGTTSRTSQRTAKLPRVPPTPRRAATLAPMSRDTALPAALEPVLTVSNLAVSVPHESGWTYPVKGVSFEVAAGEIVGIVGESGSGKSLTCMSAAGLTEAPLVVTADSLMFDGTELSSGGTVANVGEKRQVARLLGTHLSMVFQDPMSSLNPALKVGPQVAEIGQLHEGLSREQARLRAIQRMDDVKIREPERRAAQYPHELSGGMRQRAMIAMGLMGNPSLIIADEPTTALDVTVQRDVMKLLAQVNADHGTAILLISHDMAVITGLCSRVLVMNGGQIVENVRVSDLIAGRAQHPYTRALLAAVPEMNGDRTKRLVTIPEGLSFDDDVVESSPTHPAIASGARS